jgi:hypothetical protein
MAAERRGGPPDPGRERRQEDAGGHGLPDRVPCPFCGGEETELHSPFGSALSVSTYWCRRCRSPFERFKWERRGD